MRTRHLLGIVALLIVAGLVACGSSDEPGGKPTVVATTVQIGALTKVVAGTDASVRTLVGPGVDPHDFEPSADDIKRVGKAQLILRNGLGLDSFLDSAIEGSGARNVVTVSEGVKVRTEMVDGGRTEEDPHIWHNPQNVKLMVDNIAEALSAALPASEDTFRENARAYKARLDEVDAEIEVLIASIPIENRKMVTNHDAFGYFIERYGLTFVGTVIPGLSTASEASAREIADLEDTIRREHVKAVFAESSLDPKVATQIARDTGVKVVDNLYGDSLGEPGSGADTVEGMLLANARTIANALK